MRDTSLIERQIHGKVMELCFESIVSEVFINSLPVPHNELTDGLTQQFAQYATECLKDLGSVALLQGAIEGEQDPAKRNYLRKMYDICMETANNVTARILEEYKDDKQLKDAAANVTLTQKEYDRFSKSAATLTPATLTDMIQKKTLDVIETEREAYQKDAELESELKAALGTDDDAAGANGEAPPGGDDMVDDLEPDIEPLNLDSDDPTGADIGTDDDDPTDLPEIPDGVSLDAYMFPATEGLRDWFAKRKEIKSRIKQSDLKGQIAVRHVKRAEKLKPEERLAAALIGFCTAKNVTPINKKSDATRIISKSYPNPTIEMFQDVPVCIRDDDEMTLLFAGKTDKGEDMCFALSNDDTILFAAYQSMILEIFAWTGAATADNSLQQLMLTQNNIQQQMMLQQQMQQQQMQQMQMQQQHDMMMQQQMQQQAWQAHVMGVNAHTQATMGFPVMCSLVLTNGESATEGIGAMVDNFKAWLAANKELRERAKYRPSEARIKEAEKLPREEKIAAAVKGTLWYLGSKWSLYESSAAATIFDKERSWMVQDDPNSSFRYENANGIPVMVCVTGWKIVPDADSFFYDPGTVFFVAQGKNGKPNLRFISPEGMRVCPATYLEKVAPTEQKNGPVVESFSYGAYHRYNLNPAIESGISNLFGKIKSLISRGKERPTPATPIEQPKAEETSMFSYIKTPDDMMGALNEIINIIIKSDPSIIMVQSLGVFGQHNIFDTYWLKQDGHLYHDASGNMSNYFAQVFSCAVNNGALTNDLVSYKVTGDVVDPGKSGKLSVQFGYDKISDPKAWIKKEMPQIQVGRGTTEGFGIHYNMQTGAMESAFTDMMNKANKDAPTGAAIGQHGGEAAGKAKDPKKAQESFDTYMRGMAGSNYRAKHTTLFSRLQELSYEALCATTESYTEVPFDTMRLITTQNTFDKFHSHGSKSIATVMESIGRYAFESEATPDAPMDAPLKDSLLCASIIYTFFETLNSMNLYCPKLDEIRRFVDETLPIEGKQLKDQKAFIDLFKGMMAQAQSNLAHAQTVPEVDAIQGDLDIVREKCNAPGFESMRAEIETRIHNLQTNIDRKRDKLVAAQRPAQAAVESATQTMHRTRDVLKFSRAASTYGRKPNVEAMKFKVDAQGNSPYIAVECYAPNSTLANKTTIVLEGDVSGYKDIVGYVTAAMEASTLKDLHKRFILTDSRSGKLYYDSERQ